MVGRQILPSRLVWSNLGRPRPHNTSQPKKKGPPDFSDDPCVYWSG